MDQKSKAVVAIVSVFVVLLMLLLALRFVALPSFEGPETPDGPPPFPYQDHVRIGLIQSIDALNPYVGLNDASRLFYSLVYDCLTTYDEELDITGNLAVSWWMVPVTDPAMVASGDPYGSVWEYNLTHNARWHDGVAFTADDVVYNLNLHAQHYDSMWAYQPYSYFIEEAEKVDNYTVRIHFWDRTTEESMPVAWGYFIPIHILPKHLLEQLPGGYAYIGMNWSGVFPSDISPGHPIVGTGPWMADESIWSNWTEGKIITLFRNPNYHWELDKPGEPRIRLGSLMMRFFQDSASMSFALKNRELDVAKFPPTEYDAISYEIESNALEDFACYSGPSCTQGFTYLSCWMTTAGGDNDARLDPNVRKAMALAINKTWIIDNIFHGLADPGSTVVPPFNWPWHYEPNATEQMTYNVTAANQLLESSGYIDIDDDGIRECTITSKAVEMGWASEGVRLSLRVPVFESQYFEAYTMGQFLAAELEEIGVNVTLLAMSEIISPLIYCPIQEDFSISHWSSMDLDPERMLFTQSYAGLGGWSDTGFTNSSYDENFNLSVTSLDPGRQSYVDACQRILYDQCPYIVLAYPHSNYVWWDEGLGSWGDWAMDPGRSLDACWGANPLFFDLYPPIYM